MVLLVLRLLPFFGWFRSVLPYILLMLLLLHCFCFPFHFLPLLVSNVWLYRGFQSTSNDLLSYLMRTISIGKRATHTFCIIYLYFFSFFSLSIRFVSCFSELFYSLFFSRFMLVVVALLCFAFARSSISFSSGRIKIYKSLFETVNLKVH